MNRSNIASLALALATSLLAGCSTSDPSGGQLSFQPATPEGDGPVVFMRGALSGEHVSVDIVARGAPKLYGATFRLTFDPNVLHVANVLKGDVWPEGAITLSKEGAPGQLAVVWTQKGSGEPIDATGDTVLGRLEVDVASRSGSPLAFRVDRSDLVDATGKSLTPHFFGATVPAR